MNFYSWENLSNHIVQNLFGSEIRYGVLLTNFTNGHITSSNYSISNCCLIDSRNMEALHPFYIQIPKVEIGSL
jgi:hypothetical protein